MYCQSFQFLLKIIHSVQLIQITHKSIFQMLDLIGLLEIINQKVLCQHNSKSLILLDLLKVLVLEQVLEMLSCHIFLQLMEFSTLLEHSQMRKLFTKKENLTQFVILKSLTVNLSQRTYKVWKKYLMLSKQE